MAIERTYIYADDQAGAAQKLYDYLMANAVPDYFDSVSLNTEEGYVSCYSGEFEFIRIYSYLASSSGGIIIYTDNGFLRVYTSLAAAGSSTHFEYAYKCANGISFDIRVHSSLKGKIQFTITKDDEGNTAVILEKNLNTTVTASGYNNIYCINQKTGSFLYRILNLQGGYQKTAMAPFVVGDTPNYTPDAFLISYAQNTDDGIIDINGTRYISNGLWCVRDE